MYALSINQDHLLFQTRLHYQNTIEFSEPFAFLFAMQDTIHSNVLSSRARASAVVRQLNDEGARTGNDRSLSGYRYGRLSSINIRFSGFDAPIETFEWDLHDLWHAYYHAAMNMSQESPKMDRLAFQVLQTREQGILVRGTQVTDTQDAVLPELP